MENIKQLLQIMEVFILHLIMENRGFEELMIVVVVGHQFRYQHQVNIKVLLLMAEIFGLHLIMDNRGFSHLLHLQIGNQFLYPHQDNIKQL